MKKILITGSSGFIGTNACERLRDKYEVLGFDVTIPREKFDGVTYTKGNTLSVNDVNEIICQNPEVILHLAGIAAPETSFNMPRRTWEVNVIGTLNICEVLRFESPNTKLIFASAGLAYGKQDELPTTEEAPLRPVGPYETSKAAADLLCQSYLKTYGMNIAIFRSGACCGPRCPKDYVYTKFLEKAIKGKPIFFPSGDIEHPTRDCNVVSNLVDGIERIIEKDVKGVFNISLGKETSILKLAEIIVEIVGSGKIEFTDQFNYRLEEEGMRQWLDISKAKKELDYEPRVSLRDGIEQQYHWMMKSVNVDQVRSG